jgi:hypothetical protein
VKACGIMANVPMRTDNIKDYASMLNILRGGAVNVKKVRSMW